MTASIIELTIFTKSDGPLTKRISLNGEGSVVSDGSACTMARGRAQRVSVTDTEHLAALIASLRSDQAVALGALRPDLPDEVAVVTKDKLDGQERPDLIARTGSDIVYRKGCPTYVLLDFDTKGMTRDVADRMAACGGYWEALVAVLPALRHAARVIRRSTSAGLMRTDTGERLKGSDGIHIYITARDGTDAVRFLATLHERCWLRGMGWMMVGVAGQLLERSIVDRMVGAAERLVFEGAPVLEPPLAQDADSRRPIATAGEAIDTAAACPPLTLVEQQTLRKMKAEASQRLVPERNKAREAYVADQAQRIAARTGMSRDAAARVIEQQCKGVLLANVVLPFDDPDLSSVTVADVLDYPARFEGCTLADPIEGVAYGRCKAKVMRGAGGAPWINSFAHGHATYQLRYDARAASVRIEQASDPVSALVRIALSADLDDVETKQLVDQVARRAGVGVRNVAAKLKAAKADHAKERIQEMRERKLAERSDPRPQLQNPPADAPFAPQMTTINEAIARAIPRRQTCRDGDGAIARKRRFPIPNTHAFTTSNEEDDQ
jgi:hypothetical protein